MRITTRVGRGYFTYGLVGMTFYVFCILPFVLAAQALIWTVKFFIAFFAARRVAERKAAYGRSVRTVGYPKARA